MAQKRLFGADIKPDCAYCSKNATPALPNVTCTAGCKIDENGVCKRFSYDPLLRKPKTQPVLGSFDKDEFAL